METRGRDAFGCARRCTNTCKRAYDGQCSDGWIGDNMPEGASSCALGSDCADCGTRELCTVAGASQLLLPREVLSLGVPVRLLHASQVLFIILGSTLFRWKSERVHYSWCHSLPHMRCLFFVDEDQNATRAINEQPDRQIRWNVLRNTHAPEHCCARRKNGMKRGNFFCTPHRAKTLGAQYRYLPALMHAKRSSSFRRGSFNWIVMVDDDAFVFVPRLLWILSRLNSSVPLYAGECYILFLLPWHRVSQRM